MSKEKKKDIDIKIDEKEEVKKPTASEKKKAYAALIAQYKLQSPHKYPGKEKALKAKLDKM